MFLPTKTQELLPISPLKAGGEIQRVSSKKKFPLSPKNWPQLRPVRIKVSSLAKLSGYSAIASRFGPPEIGSFSGLRPLHTRLHPYQRIRPRIESGTLIEESRRVETSFRKYETGKKKFPASVAPSRPLEVEFFWGGELPSSMDELPALESRRVDVAHIWTLAMSQFHFPRIPIRSVFSKIPTLNKKTFRTNFQAFLFSNTPQGPTSEPKTRGKCEANVVSRQINRDFWDKNPHVLGIMSGLARTLG